MEYQSTQKFVRISPTKVRPVVFLIKKLSPLEAIKVLPFIGKRASEPLAKVIKTALANAKQAGVSDLDLEFKEIQIGEGPRLRRGRAGSRGRLKPYKKRMSHIKVVLKVKEADAPVKKEAKVEDKPKEAKVTKTAEKKVTSTKTKKESKAKK